jgi:hypothetical protein
MNFFPCRNFPNTERLKTTKQKHQNTNSAIFKYSCARGAHQMRTICAPYAHEFEILSDAICRGITEGLRRLCSGSAVTRR